MKFSIIIRATCFLIAFFLSAPLGWADKRQVSFPIADGFVASSSDSMGFAYEEQVGFLLAYSLPKLLPKLFSFSVKDAKALHEFDLKPEFVAAGDSDLKQSLFLQVHAKTGLVAVFGPTSKDGQRIIVFASDREGNLHKLWSTEFPLSLALTSSQYQLTFNRDGSKIYFLNIESHQPLVENLLQGVEKNRHSPTFVSVSKPSFANALLNSRNQSSLQTALPVPSPSTSGFWQRLRMFNAQDGATLASINLEASLPYTSVLLDEERNRVIALAGASLYTFSDNEALEIESQINAPGLGGVTPQGISQDGRFLIAYTGYELETNENYYLVYDLDSKLARETAMKGDFLPISNNMAFNRATGALLVPFTIKPKVKANGTLLLIGGHVRQTDVLLLKPDSSLVKTTEMEIPAQSEGDARTNFIGGFNNVVISKTGAIGFIPSGNGRLFSFDTVTGEIVNDESLDAEKMDAIQLLEASGKLTFNNRSNKLILVDVHTEPVITDVKIKKKTTLIKGANFLSGVKVKINGVEVTNAERNAANPGREIIVNLGKKDFPTGQDVVITLVNRDGLTSKPFSAK